MFGDGRPCELVMASVLLPFQKAEIFAVPEFRHVGIDVTLVSGCRPDLLRRTMESFQERVFQNFKIANFRINIDPFGGDEADRERCRKIALQHFPDAKITEPSTPSYGQAVKTLWASVSSDFALHLEDDWIALEPITPEMVFALFHEGTASVKLNNKELHWDGRELRTRIEKIKFAGFTIWHRRVPSFGVSPGFFRGEFVRRYSTFIDPDLDPEKQQRTHINRPLTKFTSRFDCRVLPGQLRPEIIQDIGREWRQDRGMEKVVRRGRSVWMPTK